MSGFKVRAVGKKSAEVYLYDEIGASMWGGGISAKSVADEIKSLGQVETIQVRINSPGGDVFDGLAIYNTLARHPAHVETHIDGMALSIASVIAMAGNEVHMAENAMLMIHDPWTVAMGSADEFRKKADLMDQVKGNLVDTYARRAGLPAEQIAALMSEETWLTAKDAQHLGFVDEIAEELQLAASFDLSRFRNAPKAAGERTGRNIYRAKIREIADRANRVLAK
jgi:ATP-dependent Clp protease protease subunit